jgi:acetyl-CoA carboxylase biotin carboxylase subunit
MSAAELAGVDAIHPGYGFLSENFEFANVCRAYGIKFIGPKPEHIHALGNKVSARAIAEKADVPMLPGRRGVVRTEEEAIEIAREIGYPLIIKAAAGGGGRGMKIVREEGDLLRLFQLAQVEALNGFGNPDCFIERYCARPRHVEIQLVADEHGNIRHLGERDCSIQRRHQKLIEEAPCPVMTAALRERMGAAAVEAARAVGYVGAGTVEFLLDAEGHFYFLEMNTRLQVEHPVTEMITGIDLVREQIRIAEGLPLSVTQEEVEFTGHAIECRINAEDPKTFAPSPGLVKQYHAPGGMHVRVDSGLYAGYRIPPYYDSMIAKLIVYGRTREGCIMRLRRALEEMVIDGVKTSIPLHQALLREPDFLSGDYSIKWLEEWLAERA